MDRSYLRIQEALQFFENNDHNLGFRKMLDCVADTHNIQLYGEAIALTDWKENNLNNTTELKTRSIALMQKLMNVPVYQAPTEQTTIVAHQIEKSYGIGKFALGPVSLSLHKGQILGLVGENGNGKTTLLRILAKEMAYNSGSLSYHLHPRVGDDFDLRTKLVYIAQRTQKWYGSLSDNLKLVLTHYHCPPAENETRMLMMVARLGLWKYKDLKWSELSSGYKMRFELARTLLRNPEIMLLDEPLANLDILSQQIILEDLKSISGSLSRPIALILSSQQLYEVEKVSDKVIFLRNGKYIDNSPARSIESESQELIVEIDSSNSRDELWTALSSIHIKKLVFNGGVYVATFAAPTHFSAVLETLGKDGCDISYIRNISSSTRRFFVD